MHADCGYAAATISSHTGLPDKQVRAIIRGFEAYGWAFRHPFHSEDDNLIHGSGYSLTNTGWDARQAASSFLPLPAGDMGEIAHV
jgi:hypothetical protein